MNPSWWDEPVGADLDIDSAVTIDLLDLEAQAKKNAAFLEPQKLSEWGASLGDCVVAGVSRAVDQVSKLLMVFEMMPPGRKWARIISLLRDTRARLELARAAIAEGVLQ